MTRTTSLCRKCGRTCACDIEDSGPRCNECGNIDHLAALVHQAYLDACARLGWTVRPDNAVPYEQLSEASKELDRATVRAVLDGLRGAP
jgi:hypothetical protein